MNLHPESQRKKVAIIGGGISGLSAALTLAIEGNIEPVLYEASGRFGGSIKTEHHDDFLLEHGPDMFTRKEPEAYELCEKLGIENELIGTNSENRRALIGFSKRLFPVPEGFSLLVPTKAMSILKTQLLTATGKVRLLGERLILKKRSEKDESLESFATRRFGRQAFERLIQPLVAGIYTADPKKLSMQATMKQFVELEKKYGSIIKGAWRTNMGKEKSAGARYNLFMAPRKGMQFLVDSILKRLDEVSENSKSIVNLNSKVTRISKHPKGWLLHVNGREEKFDGVIVAAPATVASELFQYGFARLSGLLGKIEYAGSAVLLTAFNRSQINHPLNAFGLVFPAVEDTPLIASSFASQKFALRAADDKVLLRTFVGGALNPQILEKEDSEITKVVLRELDQRLGISGDPIFSTLARWPNAMPQYHVGHLKLVDQIETQINKHAGLEIAGNAFNGVGIPACIRSGQNAARRLSSSFSETCSS